MVEGQAWATAFQSYMFSCLLGMEVQCVNASYKFWSIGKENPLFLVMVEVVRFRRKRLQFGQFSPARNGFSLFIFSRPEFNIRHRLVCFFWFLSSFLSSIFLCFFPAARSSISDIVFFIFVSLLLASHSFRLTISGWLCSFNSNLLRRSTLINLTPSSRYLSTGRRSNLCAKLCRHTGQVVLYKKGRSLYVRR